MCLTKISPEHQTIDNNSHTVEYKRLTKAQIQCIWHRTFKIRAAETVPKPIDNKKTDLSICLGLVCLHVLDEGSLVATRISEEWTEAQEGGIVIAKSIGGWSEGT